VVCVDEEGSEMNEAMAEIATHEARIQVMGANDSETGDLIRIRREMTDGKITPDQGVARAYEILNSKQDYH